MRIWVLLLLLLTLSACEHPTIIQANDPDLVNVQNRTTGLLLVSINIMDRNGMSETISAKERLKTFDNVNFLTQHPYQKVLRVFAKDKSGNSLSLITSYYPTGQIRQYLEAVNGRAHGRYIEWHTNGQKKLQASILGGTADLDEKSQTNWVFHETSYCWNEDGTLIAVMPYAQGLLEGMTCYYHPTGALSDEIPYHKGEIEGESKVYDPDGKITESTHYVHGLKAGESLGFWTPSQSSWKEVWQEDLLQEGVYFERDGSLISQVHAGTGKRCLFGDEGPLEIQEYHHGKSEGEVLIFGETRTIIKRLHVKDGEKHGEEICYWPHNPQMPKLTIDWVRGQIHGTVKTWYENGTQESSREMSHNLKQGLLTAWYKDGKLMLIEEYEKDRLVRGDYLKKGEMKPITQVMDGKGVATFYDSDGTFRARVAYLDGKPAMDDLLSER